MTDTDVKQEIFKRLDIAAEKLGVAANYMWHVLVRQGIAQGIADLVVAIALFVVMIIAYKLAKKWWNKGQQEYSDGNRNNSETYTICSIFGYVFFVLMFFIALYWAHDAALELVNPEYYALKQILEAIGK